MDAALNAAYGPLPAGEYWASRDNFGYHLRASALAAKKLTAPEVAVVAKAATLRAPEIAAAYTREEMLAAPPEGDSILAMSRRSYNAVRSQEVVFILKPYFMDKRPTGTNHGTPHDYDTHVPLLWFGAGIPPGVHPERVAVEDIAPTLAARLGIPPPPLAEGRRLF